MHWTVNVEGAPARVYHASVAIGDHIYTFGGRYCGDTRTQDKMEVHVLDTTTMQSTCIPTTDEEAPPNLLGHTAVVFEDKIYIWGGYHSRPFNHVGPGRLWCFEAASRRWSEPATRGAAPAPRIHHAACVAAGHMLVVGGCERRFGFPMRVAHALDLRRMEWRAVAAGADAPDGAFRAAAALPDGAVALFGSATARALYPAAQEPRGLEQVVRAAMGQLCGWSVARFDARAGEWAARAGPCVPALPAGAGFARGALLYTAAGGLTRRAADGSALEELRPAGARASARCLGACVVVRERAFFVGGESPAPRVPAPPRAGDGAARAPAAAYDRLAEHYGALQVLDFRPDLRTMCMSVVVQFNLDTEDLPRVIKQDLDLFVPRLPRREQVA